MSLLIRVFRSCLGCVFPHSKPSLGASISRIKQGLFLGFFCSFVSALLGNSANHTVFLTESDVVMGTGDNQYGQLSLPVVLESSVPIQSKFGVREVASGPSHTMHLMWDGTVWGVGNNNYGQLGDGTTTQRTNPVQVLDSSGKPFNGVVEIVAGRVAELFASVQPYRIFDLSRMR